jgi:hypothetical protein
VLLVLVVVLVVVGAQGLLVQLELVAVVSVEMIIA